MNRFFVSPILMTSAIFLGFFGLITGLIIVANSRIIPSVFLTSFVGFSIAWMVRKPFLIISEKYIAFPKNHGELEYIQDFEIQDIEINRGSFRIKTKRKNYSLPLFIYSSETKTEIINLIEKFQIKDQLN